MKRFFHSTITCLFLMLLLTACGKEVNEFSSADLLGTWKVAQSTFTTYENGSCEFSCCCDIINLV